MKRKKITIFLGFIMLLSMMFMGVQLKFEPNNSNNNIDSIVKASTIDQNNLSVVEGDILYYQCIINNEEGDPDKIIYKVEIAEIDGPNDILYYNWYRPNITEGKDWDWDGSWKNITDDEEEMGDNDRWITENFTYPIFNHTLIFSRQITDMQAASVSENTDQKIMDAFSCNSGNYSSTYSDSGSVWNKITIDLYKENNDEKPFNLIVWANKTTGIVTYYEETDVDDTFTLELMGYEGNTPGYGLDLYPFYSPDSYGLQPKDWIDRFSPERSSYDEDFGGDGWNWDWNTDDYLEENDLYNEPTQLWQVETYNGCVYGGLRSFDEDYYGIHLTPEWKLDVQMHVHNDDQNWKIDEINNETGDSLGILDSGEGIGDWDLNFTIDDYNGYFEFAVLSNFDKGGYVLIVKLIHDIYGESTIIDDYFEYNGYLDENDIYENATLIDFRKNPHYDDLTYNDFDYYKIYLEDNDNIYLEANNWGGDLLTLSEIDPNTGDVMQSSLSSDNDFGLQLIEDGSGGRDVIIAFNGSTLGQNYHFWFNPLYPPFEPSGNYADYFEPNDDYTNAFDLNSFDPAPSMLYGGLNTFENPDYYRFHLEDGNHVSIMIQFYPGADVALSRINPNDGNVISGPVGGETDKNGHAQLQWDASYSGDYIVRVAGETGNFGDCYTLRVEINYEWGGEYWPEIHDDYDRDDRGLWTHETIEFVYYNPYTNEDVIVVSTETFKSPDMIESGGRRTFQEMARINCSNPNQVLGKGYFNKDLDFESSEFINWFTEEIIEKELNLTNPILNTGPGFVELTGEGAEDGLNYYLYAEQLGHESGYTNVGVVRFFKMDVYNSSAEYKDKEQYEMNMIIDCSVPGSVVESHNELGVDEDDWIAYLVQDEGEENSWGDKDDYHHRWATMHFVNFTVTHIFALNATVLGVVGSMEHYSSENAGEPDFETFQPLLVWDTQNPVSFMTMGGLGHIEGPPILLPAGVDWSTQEANMNQMFENMEDGPGLPTRAYYSPNSLRLKFHNDWEEGDNYGFSDTTILLDVNEFGFTTHLEQSDRFENRWEDGEHESGYEHNSQFSAFAVASSKNLNFEPNPESVTGINPSDEFIWERCNYRPAQGEDPGSDPDDKEYSKYIIGEVRTAGDGSVVFLGSRYYKGPDDTSYQGDVWQYKDPEGEHPTPINFWLLGSIRDDDLWSWINSELFDIGITDLSAYENVLLDVLNFALELPPEITLTTANITIDGRTFEVSIDLEEDGTTYEHIMRLAISPQGIMQDMFMGRRNPSTGVWEDWERTTLVEASSGYDVGPIFTEDMPDYFVVEDPTNTTTDTNTTETTTETETKTETEAPFNLSNIPGYPVASVGIFSMIAILALTYRKRKREMI